MNKLNICIDIDGTVTSPYHFIPYLNEMYNKNITEEDCTTYNWESLYDIDMDRLLERFHGDYMHSYGEAEVVEGAKDVIGELYKDHNVFFVTARSEILTDVTTNWLKNNGFEEIDVYLLGSHYKIDKARELECNIFIEDSPSNAMELAGEGMLVLLIDTNYNKDINHENIIRVENWTQIKDIIEKYR
ncbi:hydrolase [Romboutsia weinsteinii]|uniref:Nucleotidase n=1 Tax=Romboutsia weinsteinii TaxID=2020949 RepID=A0A371IY73_9FIRM|nr:hydrolase [Romboutsia weinsteinii]RDY25437.1 hydrolase [Romboutsia weinsteinii]